MQAWKYAISEEGKEALIELEIPDDAERFIFNTFGRASSAIVKSIVMYSKGTNSFTRKIKKAYSAYDHEFVYESGKTVTPDIFDINPDFIFSHGIHFFTDKDIALFRLWRDMWYRNSLYRFNKKLAMRKETN